MPNRKPSIHPIWNLWRRKFTANTHNGWVVVAARRLGSPVKPWTLGVSIAGHTCACCIARSAEKSLGGALAGSNRWGG